jgi:hypothetical protein
LDFKYLKNASPPSRLSTIAPRQAPGPGACIILALSAALFVFGNVMIVIRAAVLTTPVYSSDESFHWLNARFLAAGLAPQQFDPNLRHMGNYLYFLLTGWIARAPEGPAAMRLVNYLFIALSAVFIWRLARAFVLTPLALLAAAFVFALGLTTYAVAMMPEMMFMCIMLGLALFMARAWAPHRPLASSTAGLIIGALMLVKPHGVAIFLSTALTMVAVPFALHRHRRAVIDAVPDLLALAAGTIISIIIIASLAQGRLVLSPAAFVGGFYANILSPSGAGFSLAALLDIVRYFAAHCITLLLFFAPAVLVTPLMALLALGNTSNSDNDAANLRSLFVLVVFTILSALGLFAMISVFTHVVGSGNSFEANRIHGRYWGFLIPLFVTITLALFELSNRDNANRLWANRWLERGASIVWLIAILVFGARVSSSFTLYPWDFPDLFEFYRPIYAGWPYAAWLPSSFAIVITLLTVCALAHLVACPARRLCYVVSLAAAFAIGNVKATGWQIDIMSDIRPLVDAAQAATRIVGRQSEGLFVASEYYGRTPYVTFQVPLRTFIAIKPVNAALTDADVPPSAKWVLTMAPYPVQFRYSNAISLAPLTLYLRGTEP